MLASEHGPEPRRRGLCRGQHGRGLDGALKVFVQPLDHIGRPCRRPLARGLTEEGEETIARFLKATGGGTAIQSPLTNERRAVRLDVLYGLATDHLVVVGWGLLMQSLRSVRQKVAVLMRIMPASA